MGVLPIPMAKAVYKSVLETLNQSNLTLAQEVIHFTEEQDLSRSLRRDEYYELDRYKQLKSCVG